MVQDAVYALHEFKAENPDELSFTAGERIIVLERDDQYNDGWFQGRNTLGEEGLFPQSYTSSQPPTPTEGTPVLPKEDVSTLTSHIAVPGTKGASADASTAAAEALPATAMMKAEMEEVQQALNKLSADRELNGEPDTSLRSMDDAASITSRTSRLSDDEGGANTRTSGNHRALLAAKAAENAEQDAQKERDLAEKRRKDDEETYERARKDGLVEGLQMSDESDTEQVATNGAVGGSAIADEEKEDDKLPQPKDRRDTVGSVYPDTSFASVASSTTPAVGPVSEKTGTETSILSDIHQAVPTPVIAAGAALATGAAAAAAATFGISSEDNTSPTRELTDTEATPLLSNGRNKFPAPSLPVISTASTAFKSVPVPLELISPHSAFTHSNPDNRTPTSFTSALSKSVVSPVTPLSSVAGNGTTPTSTNQSNLLHDNVMEKPQTAKALPQDPTTWGVADVVEWGKSKGFDPVTLSKFQEHEISGDVLLEMDVAMLKEIDLIAFGRRVHIYNAIKELRAQVPSASRSTSQHSDVASPVLSGYEPDSPGTSAFASPAVRSSFGGFSTIDSSPMQETNLRRSVNEPVAVAHTISNKSSLQGLGLENDVSSMSTASSIVGHPNDPTPAISTVFPSRARGSIDQARPSLGATPIPEEGDDFRKSPIIPAAIPRPARPVQAKRMGSTSRKSDKESQDELTATPTSPRTGPKAFFQTIGRARKPPPPRLPSSSSTAFSDGDSTASTAVNRRSLVGSNKRSTRIFGSFGGSGSDKNANAESAVRTASYRPPKASTRDGPSSMAPKNVDEATDEMKVKQAPLAIGDANLLEKIGKPDYSGWMQKKGEKYNTWKQRFFVLKGIHLYYLKSESEQRAKGFINLTGYRVISDPNVHVGFYGFKLVHDYDRPHYFSAEEQVTLRNWMKEIMKATIGRDYTAEVVSSCDIETLPLSIAQTMSPRPRPPSPESRARAQKQRYAGQNPNTLSPKDAQILMEFTSSQKDPKDRRSFAGSSGTQPFPSRPKSASPPTSPATVTSILPSQGPPVLNPIESTDTASATETSNSEMLEWVNDHLPEDMEPVSDLSASLRSGKVLVRLLEHLSEQESGITDAEFAKYQAAGAGAFDADYFDVVFNVFDYISPIVSTDEVSMDDMLSGREPRMVMLLERYKASFLVA